MTKFKIRNDINFQNERFLMFVIDQMANEYERKGQEIIRLTLGKSELPVHEDIEQAMEDAISDYNKYSQVFPGGLPELKEALADYYHKVYGIENEPENYLISVGTSSIFRNLFQLLVEEGDEILLPYPYYSLYHFCALLCKADIKYYHIDPYTMRLDKDSFRRNFTSKTRVVVINTPGNPLGNIMTRDELNYIDEVVNGKAVIINDEIYANMYFDEKCLSVMQLKNTKSQFITTNAFSKGFRMYSRRVGYCILPKELITPMTVMQHHTLLTLDPIVQYGAIAALEHLEEVDSLRELYKERRDYTMKRLNNISGITPLRSEGSFYITIDCEEFMKRHKVESGLKLAESILHSKYVAVVPGSDFGLNYMIRLSFSSKKYKEGIDRLADYFNGK